MGCFMGFFLAKEPRGRWCNFGNRPDTIRLSLGIAPGGCPKLGRRSERRGRQSLAQLERHVARCVKPIFGITS